MENVLNFHYLHIIYNINLTKTIKKHRIYIFFKKSLTRSEKKEYNNNVETSRGRAVGSSSGS